VSDADLDELAEAARNRGLKLVRSRVRTPTKRRFGKVGLTDKAGKPVLGMDAKGPIGDLGEIEQYLRNLGAKDWGASLDSQRRSASAPARSRRAARRSPRTMMRFALNRAKQSPHRCRSRNCATPAPPTLSVWSN
jgi:hypothetical protein